jgi:F0F1-type ATP synthase assembly protein I
MERTITMAPKAPLKLSLRTARILSVAVLAGIGIGYLGGAIMAEPDGTAPIGFVFLRLIGLFSAVALFIEGRGQLTQSSDAMLDERERALRDKAYVGTHQIMIICMFGFFIWSILAKLIDGWMPGQEQALDLLSGFAIGSMALPGIMLAWRETPEPVDDEA